MSEAQVPTEVAPPGPDDAAARHADGRYLNHETGEPYETSIPDPVPGALPWTNADVRAMVEGRQPNQPKPWVEAVDNGVEQPDGSVTFNVPGQVEVDTGQRPINVTPDGVNHFKRIMADAAAHGREAVCGGCGAVWPCDHAMAISVQVNQQHAAGIEANKLQAAAALTGHSPHRLAGQIGPS
jgi:hypothetical protein